MPFLIAILGCAAAAALWMLYPQRFNPSDPWAYSQNAWEISRSLANFLADAPNHPFSHRLAVTVPVAALYALFGVSVWITNLWPLLGVFAVIAALCFALPSNRERALAVFLCVTCVGLLRQSTQLYADIIAMGFLFPGAVVLQHRARTLARGGVAFALLVFAAFLAKETAYWVLPLWIYALASDLRAGDRTTARRFHLGSAATMAVLGVAYMVFCRHVWGHPLARLISVQELTGHHLWSWQNATGYDWFKRLALSPVKLLLVDFGPALLLALGALWAAREAPRSRERRFWTVYSGSMILLFWFGSTAFTRYEPLPALPRMVLPAIPGLFVLAAGLAPRLWGPRSGWARAAVFASLLPLIAYAFTWDFSADPRERAADLVRAEVAKGRRVLLLTADVRSPGHLAFYFGYDLPANLVIRDIESLVEARVDPRPSGLNGDFDTVFLFSNRALSKILFDTYANENFAPRLEALELPVVFEQGNARLSGVRDPQALLRAVRERPER